LGKCVKGAYAQSAAEFMSNSDFYFWTGRKVIHNPYTIPHELRYTINAIDKRVLFVVDAVAETLFIHKSCSSLWSTYTFDVFDGIEFPKPMWFPISLSIPSIYHRQTFPHIWGRRNPPLHPLIFICVHGSLHDDSRKTLQKRGFPALGATVVSRFWSLQQRSYSQIETLNGPQEAVDIQTH